MGDDLVNSTDRARYIIRELTGVKLPKKSRIDTTKELIKEN
jgi:hypothetical protein